MNPRATLMHLLSRFADRDKDVLDKQVLRRIQGDLRRR